MLQRICANCGRRLSQGDKCVCQKARHKIYNAEYRDEIKNDFYHSAAWKKVAAAVKARANGLDEYLLSQGCLEQGTIAHHIFPIDESADLKLSMENLIFVSASTHNYVHEEYRKSQQNKKAIQARLKAIVDNQHKNQQGVG